MTTYAETGIKVHNMKNTEMSALGQKRTSDLSFNHLIGASGRFNREDNNQQKIPRHIVNCETKRNDCAYSVPGGSNDYRSRTGVGSFGTSPCGAHGSSLWFNGRGVDRIRSVRCKTCSRLYRQQ